MKILLKNTKDNVWLIFIIFFAFSIRVLFLNKFPIGITHDELNYIISAKSLFLTHGFFSGTAPALLPTNMSNFTVTVAEVPSVILALTIGWLKTSLFTSRILGALLGTLIILAIYLVVKELTNSRKYATICSLLMAINPWSFLMSRTIFEVNFFVAFFLIGLFVLIKNKGWKIFYALPFYLLGFLSYTGGQISFYLYILITLAYHYLLTKKSIRKAKPYIVFASIVSIIFVFYFITIFRNQSYVARGSEIYSPFSGVVASQVDTERKLSVPNKLNSLFINKATVYITGFVEKQLNLFSINNLFINGEVRAAFSYQNHGPFYLIDLVFILLGLSYLYSLNKKLWLLIISVILVGSLTSGLSLIEQSYSQRAGIVFPFIVILVGGGITFLTSLSNRKIIKTIIVFVLIFVYIISFANLLHIYFYRFPVYASDGWFFQDRVLSRYIDLTQTIKSNSKIVVSTSEPKIVFEEFLFYTNNYTKDNVNEINQKMNTKVYEFNNISFVDACPETNLLKDIVWIRDGSFNCPELNNLKGDARITRLKDVFESYIIYNDKLCASSNLNRYVLNDAYKDFAVEDQSQDEFCTNWITRL